MKILRSLLERFHAYVTALKKLTGVDLEKENCQPTLKRETRS